MPITLDQHRAPRLGFCRRRRRFCCRITGSAPTAIASSRFEGERTPFRDAGRAGLDRHARRARARAATAGPIPPRVGSRAGRAPVVQHRAWRGAHAMSHAVVTGDAARTVRSITAAAAASDRQARARLRCGAPPRRCSPRIRSPASAPTTSACAYGAYAGLCRRRPAHPQQQHVSRDARRRRRARRGARLPGCCGARRRAVVDLGSRAARRCRLRARRSASAAAALAIALHAVGRLVSELRADLRAVLADPRMCRRVCARHGDPAGCESRLTAPRCGPDAPASATTPNTCCITWRRRRTQRRADRRLEPRHRHDVAAAAAGARGDAVAPRAAAGLDADARRHRAARSRGRRRPFHQRHAAADRRRCPTVVTIHDMSLRLYPRYHPPRRVILNRPLVDLAARRADAIITLSESAKRDIVRLLQPGSASRARGPRGGGAVVHARARHRGARSGAPRATASTNGSFSTSARSSRGRTCRRLIDAFAARRRSGELSHQLVCVGPYGWLSRGIDEQISARRVGGRDQVHRLRAVRGPAGALQPRRDVRLPVDVRRASACRSSRRWRAACR